MGTHPIFESDFDCLTVSRNWVRNDLKSPCIMSKVIRLKHLPDEADSNDIRNFFKKIEIPDGGVRILGGEKGIVYISLTSDEHASKALQKDGKKIYPENGKKGKRIRVVESSQREMQ